MKRRITRCLAQCLALLGPLWTSLALAQPALERVEQQLRTRTPARTAAAGDTADDANKNAGYLGIIGDDRQENGKGVRVTRSDAGGPAAKGGMKVGDLITAIDDQPVKSMEEMAEIMSRLHAGSNVKFSIERNSESQDLQVRLERRPPVEKRLVPDFGKQPEDAPAPGAGPALGPAAPVDSMILNSRRPKMGIKTDNLTAFIREQFRVPGSYVAGVFVTYVDPESPAGKAGLPTNSIITSVDGLPIDSPDTLAALVHRAGPGQTLRVTYYYRDHESVAPVTLAGGPPQPPAPGPQATTRAKPLAPGATPAQPPGFVPEGDDDSAGPMKTAEAPPADIEALQRRIAELEKRVADLEAAAIVPENDNK
ncbi:MAG TPA: PDZ domain-containing protein [Pirellulales bacterium]|nr:PDZ domain-containing protein [Pirellulales bacterium]